MPRARPSIEGVAELRAKETDRLAAIVEIVTGLGGGPRAAATRLRVAGRRCAGAPFRAAATTAWRCSARWPASPVRTASR